MHIVPSVTTAPADAGKGVFDTSRVLIEPGHGGGRNTFVASAALGQVHTGFQTQLLTHVLMTTEATFLGAETATVTDMIFDSHPNI
jgi:hypothetical protein